MSAAKPSAIPSTHLLAADTYLGPMIVSIEQIEREAREAARKGESLNHSCPYPFCSDAGQHFKKVHAMATEEAQQNNREQQS